jgi:hypothetical protein
MISVTTELTMPEVDGSSVFRRRLNREPSGRGRDGCPAQFCCYQRIGYTKSLRGEVVFHRRVLLPACIATANRNDSADGLTRVPLAQRHSARAMNT